MASTVHSALPAQKSSRVAKWRPGGGVGTKAGAATVGVRVGVGGGVVAVGDRKVGVAIGSGVEDGAGFVAVGVEEGRGGRVAVGTVVSVGVELGGRMEREVGEALTGAVGTGVGSGVQLVKVTEMSESSVIIANVRMVWPDSLCLQQQKREPGRLPLSFRKRPISRPRRLWPPGRRLQKRLDLAQRDRPGSCGPTPRWLPSVRG